MKERKVFLDQSERNRKKEDGHFKRSIHPSTFPCSEVAHDTVTCQLINVLQTSNHQLQIFN